MSTLERILDEAVLSQFISSVTLACTYWRTPSGCKFCCAVNKSWYKLTACCSKSSCLVITRPSGKVSDLIWLPLLTQYFYSCSEPIQSRSLFFHNFFSCQQLRDTRHDLRSCLEGPMPIDWAHTRSRSFRSLVSSLTFLTDPNTLCSHSWGGILICDSRSLSWLRSLETSVPQAERTKSKYDSSLLHIFS
jgi:hypothetical protein